jgi:hypothetical protein
MHGSKQDCRDAIEIVPVRGPWKYLLTCSFRFLRLCFFNQDGWHSAVQDQMILSNADIILAAKTSSFTQSLPMSIATGRVQYPDSPHNHPRRPVFFKKPFCEGVPPLMRCFQSVGEWCCNTLDRKPTYHDAVPTWRQWV